MRAACLAFLALLGVACGGRAATPSGASDAAPKPGAGPVADPDKDLGRLGLCKTTEADLRRDYGTPYRVGLVHGRRLVTWRLAPPPGSKKDDVPLIALFDARGVLVDVCYDPPGAVKCDPSDQCGERPAASPPR